MYLVEKGGDFILPRLWLRRPLKKQLEKKEGDGEAEVEESEDDKRARKHTLVIRWHLDYVKILHVVLSKFHI